MLNTTKILDEINCLLVANFPNHKAVYIDTCPVNFERPSFLVKFVKLSRKDANCKTIKEIGYYTITCIGETDDPANSSGVLAKVTDLFRSGYIRVEDRSVKVQANGVGKNTDTTFVDVHFEWYEDRWEKESEKEKIKDIQVNYKEEQHGIT